MKKKVNKIKLKYTVATWSNTDGISFGTAATNSQLYLIKSTSNNPTIANMRDYHTNVSGITDRNFSDSTNVIPRPDSIQTKIYNTTFNIGTDIGANDGLKQIQNLTLGGYMRATGGWYLAERGQWFKSNTVYGLLQTPSLSIRQDNLGIFTSAEEYLNSLSEASKLHPNINSKSVVFVKANTNAGVIVFQNMTDTNSLVYDIQNGKAVFYERVNTDTTTWTETRSIDLKNGIFK